MKVGLLTIDQKENLTQRSIKLGLFFNPFQDANDNWVITKKEIDDCQIDWVKNLPLIDLVNKPSIDIFGING